MFNNYNPYYQQPRYSQPVPPTQVSEQPQYIQQIPQFVKQNGLQGKQVDSLDVVKATDVPFDGSVSYFPLTDGSAIVTKQLQMDGTSKVVIFKPIEEEKPIAKYVTPEELEKSLKNINSNEIEDIKDDIKNIKNELKDLKKKKKDE